MLTPTHQAIKQQVQSASCIHADETRHQRGGERRWMWLALSKVAVCFMTAFGRGQDAPNGCWLRIGWRVGDRPVRRILFHRQQPASSAGPMYCAMWQRLPTAAKRSISPLGQDWCFSQIAYSGFDIGTRRVEPGNNISEGLSDVGKLAKRAAAAFIAPSATEVAVGYTRDDEMLWRFLKTTDNYQ